MAQLNLTKPICFFDLETTGTQVASDRIVEISILKVTPDQEEILKTWRVNPGIPIPPEVTAIHGISNEDVADKPSFKELAREIEQFIQGADLAGYNSNRFDLPLLAEEFLRVDIDFDLGNRKSIDVQGIFFKKEPRTLEAAYKFYCNKSLENAHSAEADTIATYEVLKSQLDRYEDLENNMNVLSDFSAPSQGYADFAGFLRFNKEGKEIFSFGKYKGQVVEDVLLKDQGYFAWIQNADFPLYTKKVLTRIKLRNFSKS